MKVAIAIDFMTAFSRIPKKQQGKVLDFFTKFRTNPTSHGINYEKIEQAKDANMRSVRIDKDYRGIVLKPESGDVYVLLWVDHHDKAYQWAKNKMCRIHPDTGSIQLIETESIKEISEAAKTDNISLKPLFDEVRDRHLLKLGVPEICLPLVRNIKTEEELDDLGDKLPQEAFEALFFIASGYSIEDVFKDMNKSEESAKINTDDFDSALNNPDSRRRFYVVEDDLELIAILNEPLEKWRVFLHPSQQQVVERSWSGSVRVLGGAGTGKTVAAMHRARYLAKHIFTNKNDYILFTTFSRNLAADIRENLSKICDRDILRRIEVVNLDKWVSDFLKKSGYDFEIDYNNKSKLLWTQALDSAASGLEYPMSFYREEWERVIQPQGIKTPDEYFKASRLGRGVRLNRKERKSVWTVFEEYRALLTEKGIKEIDEAINDACHILKSKGNILPYRSIIVDEAQDFGTQAFKLIRQMVPEGTNDLFIVGDSHQRIYRHKVVLSQCDIQIRGRSKKLLINYRTTDEIRKWADGLLKETVIDDMDGDTDSQKGYKSLLHGIKPEIRHFKSLREEIEFIYQYILKIQANEPSNSKILDQICLVARTNDLLKQYENYLKEKNLPVYYVKRSEPEDRTQSGLRLATMHRVKGLEFDRMIIAGVNDGIIPYEGHGTQTTDQTVVKENEIRERALLYVSATRAKKEVLITSFGKASRFLIKN